MKTLITNQLSDEYVTVTINYQSFSLLCVQSRKEVKIYRESEYFNKIKFCHSAINVNIPMQI